MNKNTLKSPPEKREVLSYRDQLVAELARRKMGNPSYSLRSFAKTLGVSAAFLSKILRGQKDLSLETAVSIAEKLGYNMEERAQFCQMVQMSKTSDPAVKQALSQGLSRQENSTEYHSLDLEAFQVISDWYHYAILELSGCVSTRGEELDSKWISKRLGISEPQAQAALSRLIRLGLLKNERGRLVKSQVFLATSASRPSRAIRNFHHQMIEKAKQSIESQPMELRDISGTTIAISRDKIEIAQREIQAFRRKMAKLLDSSRPSHVYQLNVQFFSLTIHPEEVATPSEGASHAE